MIIGIFNHFFALETTLAERQFFRALAKLIGRRAARLSACGIAAIVSKMGYLDEGCSVGADGSLYNVSHSNSCSIYFADKESRNTLDSLIASMKVYKIYLGRRAGTSLHIVRLRLRLIEYCSSVISSPITQKMGVVSAVLSLRVSCYASSRRPPFCLMIRSSNDEDQKRSRSVSECLIMLAQKERTFCVLLNCVLLVSCVL